MIYIGDKIMKMIINQIIYSKRKIKSELEHHKTIYIKLSFY